MGSASSDNAHLLARGVGATLVSFWTPVVPLALWDEEAKEDSDGRSKVSHQMTGAKRDSFALIGLVLVRFNGSEVAPCNGGSRKAPGLPATPGHQKQLWPPSAHISLLVSPRIPATGFSPGLALEQK